MSSPILIYTRFPTLKFPDRQDANAVTGLLAFPPIRAFLRNVNAEFDNIIGALIEENGNGYVEYQQELELWLQDHYDLQDHTCG